MIRRRSLAYAATALVAAGAGLAWQRFRGPGAEALDDTFWSLRFDRPEGGELAFTSLRGQTLVINFWATWCPPCIRELPEFDRLQRSPAGRNVQVVGLAVDGPTPVRQFLARQPVGFAVGLAGFEGTELSRRLGNSTGALPFTVVVDSRGVVRQRKLGETDFDELTRWLSAL